MKKTLCHLTTTCFLALTGQSMATTGMEESTVHCGAHSLSHSVAFFLLSNGCDAPDGAKVALRRSIEAFPDGFIGPLFAFNDKEMPQLLDLAPQMDMRRQILDLFQDLAPRQYTDFINASQSLLKNVNTDQRSDVLQGLRTLPANMRTSIAHDTGIILPKLPDTEHLAFVLRAVSMVPHRIRQRTLDDILPLAHANLELQLIVPMVLMIDEEDRSQILKDAAFFLEKVSHGESYALYRLTHLTTLLKMLNITTPKKREAAREHAPSLVQKNSAFDRLRFCRHIFKRCYTLDKKEYSCPIRSICERINLRG